MRIVAISGSLRAASLNTALLRSVVRNAPSQIEVLLYKCLGTLPLYNEDIETTDPAPVARLRGLIIEADAVIIASPEYAHGVSGAIKNGLDWMVGNESFVNKPVALFNASPRAVHALEALRETLVTMSARIVTKACITVPILGAGLDEEGIVSDPEIKLAVTYALITLEAFCRDDAAALTFRKG
jgi:chromate reductase, NAD(P)H dehydrogenase (quinone)